MIAKNSFAELKDAGRSMLSGNLPVDYGRIETTQDAVEAAKVPPPNVVLRLTIVWDNDAKNLPLESVLDHMRETGAAMVVRSEQVTK